MMLVLLVFALAALPLALLSKSYTKLVLLSAYAGLAHLLLMAAMLGIVVFSMRCAETCRAVPRRRC